MRKECRRRKGEGEAEGGNKMGDDQRAKGWSRK